MTTLLLSELRALMSLLASLPCGQVVVPIVPVQVEIPNGHHLQLPCTEVDLN